MIAAEEEEGLQISPEDVEPIVTIGLSRFGRVKLAQHRMERKYFALKVLSKGKVLQLEEAEHVVSEKPTLKALDHPFIVKIISTMQDAKVLLFLMEYIPGGTLLARIRASGRLSNEIARFYAAQVMLVIEYLHAKGLAYRDINPENMMIMENGYLKMVDFANVKKMWDEKGKPIKAHSHVGVAAYQPPEIIKGTVEGHNLMVDWWSFGCLIFEMLTGYAAFYDVNPLGCFEKIIRGHVEYPAYIQRNAKEIMEQLMVPDPSVRLGRLEGAKGSQVRRSRWMKPVDFDGIASQQIPAPWIPVISHAGDHSNFDDYPPSVEDNIVTDKFSKAKEAFRSF